MPSFKKTINLYELHINFIGSSAESKKTVNFLIKSSGTCKCKSCATQDCEYIPYESIIRGKPVV